MSRRRARGFTLVELAVVLAVSAVLLSVAVPSWQSHLAKARRADAIAALTRLQSAQEMFRSHHGSYALAFTGLQGAASERSAEGRYQLAFAAAGANSYTARARAVDEPWADPGCRELTVTVVDGIAERGPSLRCWNQ